MIEDLKQVRDALADLEPVVYDACLEYRRAGMFRTDDDALEKHHAPINTALATLDRIISDHIPDASKMVVPDGYALVPIEPTDYQLICGQNAMNDEDKYLSDIYKAMISAAPQPPTKGD